MENGLYKISLALLHHLSASNETPRGRTVPLFCLGWMKIEEIIAPGPDCNGSVIFFPKNCVISLSIVCCSANKNLCCGVKLYLDVFRGKIQSHNYSWNLRRTGQMSFISMQYSR